WSPAQVVALAIGLFFAVLGGIALARTGLDLNDVHHPHRIAGWGDWHHTPLLALIELGFGVLMMLAGALPGAWRGLMGLLGPVAPATRAGAWLHGRRRRRVGSRGPHR